MKNLEVIRQRYLKEPWQRRLGHLASDLARVAGCLGDARNANVVDDILEESKFFIEWTAPEAPHDIQAFLSAMQPQLALWQLRFRNKKIASVEGPRRQARAWSARLAAIYVKLA